MIMPESLIKDKFRIQQKIQTAFEEIEETRPAAPDIAFHMTDWLEDIENLQKTFSNIENLSSDEITSFIYRFLAHVPNHLNAAMKLSGMGKVEDVFGAGIFEDNNE
jgi:hypothetical protein